MKLIPVKYKDEEHFAMVDDEDYNELIKDKWYLCSKKRYSKRPKREGLKIIYVTMHREIFKRHFNLLNNQGIDHIDGNGLNNQKQNLRIATQKQNMANRKKTKRPCSSKYIGVCFIHKLNKWTATLKEDNNHIGLGHWESEHDAALARDIFAKERHLDFVVLNIINPSEHDLKRVKEKLDFRFRYPRRSEIGKTSNYIGVRLTKEGGWECTVKYKGKTTYIGRFDKEIDSAMIRDLFKIKLFNKFECLNFPISEINDKRDYLLSLLPEQKRTFLL